jgi:glutamyl-tRNA synthetase
VQEFRLEDVHKSSAMFDLAKLGAFNGEYIRRMSVDEFTEASMPYLTGPFNPINGPLPTAAGLAEGQEPVTLPGAFPPDAFDEARFRSIAPHVQERARLLSEVPGVVDFLFAKPHVDEAAWVKTMTGDAAPVAASMLDAVLGAKDVEWTADALKGVVEAAGTANGLKLGKAQAPIRVAVTGRTVGPPLFESLEALGQDETIARISAARDRLVTG